MLHMNMSRYFARLYLQLVFNMSVVWFGAGPNTTSTSIGRTREWLCPISDATKRKARSALFCISDNVILN